MKKLLIGGSPCTTFSICRTHGGRETKPEGKGWELFNCFLAAKEKFQPDFFLYENNQSASKEVKEEISKQLNAPIHNINSSLVSAQSRKRFYVHNFGDIGQPEDIRAVVEDILDPDTEEKRYVLLKTSTLLKSNTPPPAIL